MGPNVISTVKYALCGLVTSAGTGAFASFETGGGCAIFFDEGRLLNASPGALVVVYDVNFIYNAPNGGAVNEIPFRQNLEQFAATPPMGLPPTFVSAISPTSGPSQGGTTVIITGANFTGALQSTRGHSAASFAVNSGTSITATSPFEAAGIVDVTVTASGGTSPTGPTDQFIFFQSPVNTPTLGEWSCLRWRCCWRARAISA